MSFPSYADYLESGEAWLGEMPKHWRLTPLKHLVNFKSGGTPSKENPDYWDGDVPWASSKDLKSELLFDTIDHISMLSIKDGAAELVPQGSVLVVVRGMILLHTFPVVRLTRPVAINQDLKALTPKAGLTSEFLAWLLRGSVEETFARLDEAAHGTKVLRMDWWSAMLLPIPPIGEQSQIARFLDRETAKIDALVGEQRRLIELLKEKRQAVISRAVAKGLDPYSPMKPSGINWLGEVPVHWEIAPLKRFWSVTDCKHLTADFVEEGIPLASIREVQSRFVNLEDAKRTTILFYELLIENGRRPLPGDLIFSRNATVGEVAQVDSRHPPFAMGQDVCLLRKYDASYSSDFIQFVILSPVVSEQLANLVIGSTFKRVNVEEIRNLIVPFPPHEQAEISCFVDRETAKLDALTSEVQRAIDLLQERRTALISAAVTGKIDVRGLAETEAA